MNWWKRWTGQKKVADPFLQDKQQLLQEIRKAHEDWVCAQNRFDSVAEKDQIDYAIYALEAAEKRYEMLLRDAKQLKLNAMQNEVKEALG